jgi:glutamate carboxypeptidase
VLLCHLDTVWPIGSFKPVWQESGDQIFGPGIYDMKAGFLQAVYALANSKEIKDLTQKVALIATSDEETGSETSKKLIADISKVAKYVLVFEASYQDGQVKTARKGTSMYKIKVIGKAAHAGLEPENGINATVEISKLINQIIQLADSKSGTTVVPTVLKSGTTTNTVPEVATLDIDCRSFEMKQLQLIDSEIRKLESSSAKVEVSGAINRPPLEEQNSKQLFQILNNKLKSVGKSEVLSAAVGGASDGNLAAAAGAQVLDGLGAVGHGAHAKTEHILKSKIESQIEMAKLLIQELCK